MSADVRIRRGADGRWYVQRPTDEVLGSLPLVTWRAPWIGVARFETWAEAVTHATGKAS